MRDKADGKRRLVSLLAESFSPEELSLAVAQAVMQVHRSVKIVLMQTSSVSGDFRTRSLELVSGEDKTLTVHREHGCVFMLIWLVVIFRLGFLLSGNELQSWFSLMKLW